MSEAITLAHSLLDKPQRPEVLEIVNSLLAFPISDGQLQEINQIINR
jgi:hypothetical protein